MPFALGCAKCNPATELLKVTFFFFDSLKIAGVIFVAKSVCCQVCNGSSLQTPMLPAAERGLISANLATRDGTIRDDRRGGSIAKDYWQGLWGDTCVSGSGADREVPTTHHDYKWALRSHRRVLTGTSL
jgi:hypothetical protein